MPLDRLGPSTIGVSPPALGRERSDRPRNTARSYARGPFRSGYTGSRPVHPIVGKHHFHAVLAKLDALKQKANIVVRELGRVDDRPIHMVRLPALTNPDRPKMRVLITGGVHGREAAGVAAAMLLIDQVIADPAKRQDIEFTFVPVVCPGGYVFKRRKNRDGVNLNRVFSNKLDVPEEVRLVRDVMKDGQYDLSVDLHASKSATGFFGIFRDQNDVLKVAMREFMKKHRIMMESNHLYTVFAPGVFQSRNTGTVKDYMSTLGTQRSFTIESPTRLPYDQQTRGLADFAKHLVEATYNKL